MLKLSLRSFCPEALVEAFQPRMGPAAIMRGAEDRDGLLLRDGQGEEPVGLREDLGLKRRIDPVARQQEEAWPARRRAEVADEPIPVRAAREAREVQDRDHAVASCRPSLRALPTRRSMRDATRRRCRARLSSVELSIR
jgi:hypothetical protein